MKFRTQLYYAFVGLSIISIVFSLGLLNKATYGKFFYELQSHVMTIAATTASQINGDLLDEIKTEKDLDLPAYKEIVQTLRKTRNANRRDDVYLKYLYIVRPDPQQPYQFLFVMDAEENPKDVSIFGDPDLGASTAHLYDHLDAPYSAKALVKDQWGEWITGYAPIYNSKQAYAGTVGADISSDLIKNYYNHLFKLTFPSFLGSLCIALLAATIFSRKIAASLNTLYIAALEIGKGHFDYRAPIQSTDEFGLIAEAMNKMAEQLQDKQFFKEGASHYISQHVLDKITQAKGQIKLKGERRKITVLFADIHDFALLSEKIPPEVIVSRLNEYFTEIIDIILKNNGIIDKLIGDGIMAEFGIPLDDPEQERNAVKAAMEMQHAFGRLCHKWGTDDKIPLKLEIGIHTGEAIVGSIGDQQQRMEYTAIGDTVNTAARLKQAAKENLCALLISEATFQALNNEFPAESLGPLKLPGKDHAVVAYKIQVAG